MTYTPKQIAEMAKMGYHITADGRLKEETKLQKATRANQTKDEQQKVGSTITQKK